MLFVNRLIHTLVPGSESEPVDASCRTNAHGQALAKRTGLEQVGNADLITTGRALKHTLGR